MNNPLVSVICPLYNAEKVLGKCIKSVLMQDYKNIELILVNDGSTDKSLKICEKYAMRDKRVFVIDKPNAGRNLARKDGVLHACGEYVFFIDNDDYIEKDAIAKLVNLAEEYSLDMVVGNYDRVFDNWGFVSKNKKQFERANELIGNEELTEQLLQFDLTGKIDVACLIWARIYRRSSILTALKTDENHLFPPAKDALMEDVLFNLVIAPFIHSCMLINDIIYHYRWGGATSHFYPYISKGGYYFDYRFEMCQKYNRLDLLPNSYCHYMKLLCLEVQRRIHYNMCTEEEIREFIETELANRKIAQWAIDHVPTTIAIETENVIDEAIKMESAQKKRYWQMKLLKVYMRFVESIC